MKKSMFVLITIAIMLFSPLLASANAAVFHEKNNVITHSYSTNWSGYAVETDLNTPQSGVVTDVKGSWIVPAISGNAKNTYSSFWVGIDGYSDGTVEQIGTDSDTNNRGQPVYYAWYEMYPAYPVNLALTIKPGDTITAEVKFDSTANMFQLTITDSNFGTFSTTQSSSSLMQRSSAEWIAEAPSSGGRVLPLANFGTVTFTQCSVTMTSGSGSIVSSYWQNDPLTMVTGTGHKTTIKAQPFGLSSDGSSFSVQWFHA